MRLKPSTGRSVSFMYTEQRPNPCSVGGSTMSDRTATTTAAAPSVAHPGAGLFTVPSDRPGYLKAEAWVRDRDVPVYVAYFLPDEMDPDTCAIMQAWITRRDADGPSRPLRLVG